MLGLIEKERAQTPARARSICFFRHTHARGFYYQHEIELLISEGKLHVITPSRATIVVTVQFPPCRLRFVRATRASRPRTAAGQHARLLWTCCAAPKTWAGRVFSILWTDSFRSHDDGHDFRQLCGQFVNGEAYAHRAENRTADAYRLIGEDRFLLEIFTTYTGRF